MKRKYKKQNACSTAAFQENAPIVMDNGSGYSKYGFASADKPTSIHRTIVGIPMAQIHVKAAALGYCMGNDVFQVQNLTQKKPIRHGIVVDWDAMERLWHHIFYNELRVAPDDHPIMLTDAPFSPTTNREKATEILFEAFGAPALHMATTALLSLYSCGMTSGLVIGSGAGVSYTCPIQEGYILPHATSRLDISGRSLTNHLLKLLAECGRTFTYQERRTVRHIKERVSCSSALVYDYRKELLSEVRNFAMDYRLPDGEVITLGRERFRAPEIMFTPSILGYKSPGICGGIFCIQPSRHRSRAEGMIETETTMATDSLQKVGPMYRPLVLSRVLVCGDTSKLPGFPERIQAELRASNPGNNKVKVLAAPHRKISSWVGGSILTSLKGFQSLWLKKEDYLEKDACLAHCKFF
ncbi:actin-like [Acipenser ruthenus]|uniref:actin-like n=1 Tax=Acipenser ruthenus TaxID=7906 RepID=UPI0027414C10|nr:actin-like [Acipenser ruthenus]